jgi:hypothetical protein
MRPSRSSQADSRPRVIRRPRTAKIASLVAVSALALVGCSPAEPGSAAVVGDSTISQATIGEQMRTLNETLDQPVDTPAPAVTRGLVTNGVTVELIDATAERLGVAITDEDIEKAYLLELQELGGEEPLLEAYAQAFVPPSEIRTIFRTRLAFSALIQALAPTGSPDMQTQVALDALVSTSNELGVSVAPRYGEWDSAQLRIVPLSDPVSVPETQPENPLGQLIPQQ